MQLSKTKRFPPLQQTQSFAGEHMWVSAEFIQQEGNSSMLQHQDVDLLDLNICLNAIFCIRYFVCIIYLVWKYGRAFPPQSKKYVNQF